MDQAKIGKFIADLRKTHGLTQLQLADKLGVSDKTISRWECGKGMPELSILMPLCEILEINVNELLSGERLSQDSYPQKAEENMLNLIRETGDNKTRIRYFVISIVLTCITIFIIIAFTILQGGVNGLAAFDYLSFLLLLVPTALLLLSTGLLRDFGNAFRIIFYKKSVITNESCVRAKEAITLSAKSILFTGILLSLLQIFALLWYANESGNSTIMNRNLSVALLSSIYGIIIYLVLLPIRCKLNILS